jgi:hypothetical protein
LKKKLTTAPSLVMPYVEKPFSIYYDALSSSMCAYARLSHGSICFTVVEQA